MAVSKEPIKNCTDGTDGNEKKKQKAGTDGNEKKKKNNQTCTDDNEKKKKTNKLAQMTMRKRIKQINWYR